MPDRIPLITAETKLLVLLILSWAARLTFRSGLTFGIIVRQLIVSCLIGYIAGVYVLDMVDQEEWVKISIFCFAVFLADDILVLVLGFSKHIKLNQESLFKKITKLLMGK